MLTQRQVDSPACRLTDSLTKVQRKDNAEFYQCVLPSHLLCAKAPYPMGHYIATLVDFHTKVKRVHALSAKIGQRQAESLA